jgi:hypothetical protein
MRIVPSGNSTVAIPFHFSPSSFAVQPPQSFALSQGGTARNNLHIDDATDDPELHALEPPSH